MRARQAVPIAILVLMALLLAGGIGFSIRTSNALTNGFRFLTQDIGVWPPSQQERELLRLHELVGQIALGGTVSAEAYSLQRDLVISRIEISRDTVRGAPALFAEDKQLVSQLEQGLVDYLAIERGRLPDAATARRLEPTLTALLSVSHQFLNNRRNAENANNLQVVAVIRQLQAVQIGTLALLCIAGGLLLWLTRRALSTDLAAAYAEVRQRAAELEASQTRLAAANDELEQQNSAVHQALAELEATMAARAALETTVQRLSFPIIPVLEGVLVLPLIGSLDHARLSEAGQRFCETIVRERAAVAILDITGVASLDTDVARELMHIARATTLLGCHPMLVGITPAAAEELVQLGFQSDSLTTKSTLQQAVALALHMRAERGAGAR
jgi:anti-anti-sigma regulatory factor